MDFCLCADVPCTDQRWVMLLQLLIRCCKWRVLRRSTTTSRWCRSNWAGHVRRRPRGERQQLWRSRRVAPVDKVTKESNDEATLLQLTFEASRFSFALGNRALHSIANLTTSDTVYCVEERQIWQRHRWRWLVHPGFRQPPYQRLVHAW